MDSININEIKFISKPLIILGVTAIMLILVFTIGLNKVKDLVTKNNDSINSEEQLRKKVAILEEVPTVISGDTTFLDIVIPSKTPVLYGIAQIKNESIKNNLQISNIKTGAAIATDGGANKSSITFDVIGEKASIYNFINSFSKTLPLMKVEKVKMTGLSTATQANISLNVFSANLPKTIPAVTSVTNDLTTEEISILKELATYSMPIFIEPEAQENQLRNDPFN